ncbi:methyl-accepting chemotaxis protein [Geoalkalibacter halelectricus]|uniref:methyl-accepting chemotaxis protein n=1 Tax=Geoalkalibacter halelectricus TaxID=2847045 RepID=UPI003D22BF78
MINNLKLRSKLLLALIGLSVVPLALALLIVSSSMEKIIDHNLQSRLNESARFIQESMEDSRRETSNYIRMLARDVDLINSILYAPSQDEMFELGSAMEDAINLFNLDLIQVVNLEGRVLRRLTVENFAHLPVSPVGDLPLYLQAREEGLASGIADLENQLAIIAVVPIEYHRRPLAYMIGTVFLDERYAQHMRHLSGAEVAFYHHEDSTRVWSSAASFRDLTFAEIRNRDLWHLERGGLPYIAAHIPFPSADETPEGMLIALDRSEMIAARQGLQQLVLATMGGVGIVAVLVGVAISRGIVRPLRQVVGNLREIAEGEADLTRRLEVPSRDEVGLLAENFNRFLARLRETVRRTLEVRDQLGTATDKIRQSSQAVNKGTLQQSQSLEESHQAMQNIDATVAGIAENLSSLLLAAEGSSSATLQVSSTTEEIAAQMETVFSKVEDLISSLNEMSTSSQQITDSLTNLSGSTQETAASVTELDAAIKEIEQAAERTNSFSQEAVQETARGKQAVDESIAGIQALCETVERATGVIQDLGNQSHAIGKILTVIDEVADQTGLLALNAAIIAAQAGQHGRGFAVVADEIGELAERTAVSTREIAAIINTLQSGTREAVDTMTTGNEKVRQEADKARVAGEALEKIRLSTLKSSEEVRGIVRATQEQARGSQQITKAVNINTDTLMQIAAAIKQHSHGIRHLNTTAEDMREIAARVKAGTSEQTVGSRQISQNMEKIRGMIENINDATRAQSERSHQVVQAMVSMREIAESNVARTQELDQVVESLSTHSRTLKDEIGAFKV